MAKFFRRIVEISLLAMIVVCAGSHLEAQALSSKYDRLIEGDLVLPGGGIARFLVRENDALVMRAKGSRDWYGMMPMVGSDRGSDIGVIFFKTSRVGHVDRIDRLVGWNENSAGYFEVSPKMVGSFEVHIKGIKLCKSGSSGSSQDIYGEDALCCVTCDDVTVCGSSVSTSCGSCGGSGGGHLVM